MEIKFPVEYATYRIMVGPFDGMIKTIAKNIYNRYAADAIYILTLSDLCNFSDIDQESIHCIWMEREDTGETVVIDYRNTNKVIS